MRVIESSVIEGQFHVFPVGALVWECTQCSRNFCWSEQSSQWGNCEYAYAVFCTEECRAKWTPPIGRPKKIVQHIGIINKDRIPMRFGVAR